MGSNDQFRILTPNYLSSVFTSVPVNWFEALAYDFNNGYPMALSDFKTYFDPNVKSVYLYNHVWQKWRKCYHSIIFTLFCGKEKPFAFEDVLPGSDLVKGRQFYQITSPICGEYSDRVFLIGQTIDCSDTRKWQSGAILGKDGIHSVYLVTENGLLQKTFPSRNNAVIVRYPNSKDQSYPKYPNSNFKETQRIPNTNWQPTREYSDPNLRSTQKFPNPNLQVTQKYSNSDFPPTQEYSNPILQSTRRYSDSYN